MKITKAFFLVVLAPLSAHAGSFLSGKESSSLVNSPAGNSRWRIMIGGSALSGVKASFSNLGNFPSPNAALPLGAGLDRDYDDGYNRVDSSGNAGGLTWNFGYANNAQNNATTGTLDLSISNSLRNGSTDERDGPHPGLDISGLYEIGEVPGLSITAGGSARWGLIAGVAYNRIDIGSSGAITSDVSRLTDSFATGGVVLPLAPYNGTFGGPGPLISDNPSRATAILPGAALVTGSRNIDADLFTMSFGSYLEMPVNSKFSIMAQGGLLLGIARGEYSFNSVTTVAGLPAQATTGKGSETDLLGGLFLGLSAHYQISDNWGAYGGIQYRYLSPLEVSANGSEASLDFDTAFLTTLGVTYSF